MSTIVKRQVQDTYLAPAEKALGEDCRFWIDYTKDLSDVDPADSIFTSVWTIEGSVTESDSGYDGNLTWIRLAGGTKIGTLHRCTNTVVTIQGDTFVRVLTVKIVNIHAKRPNDDEVVFTTPTPV